MAIDAFYANYPVEGGVTSLNGLTGALTLVAGSGITISPGVPGAGDITISSTGLTSAILSINSDTTAAQTLSVGTSGTDFAIVDAGGGSHVFNLPTASAVNRGALSSADWSTFNSKQPAGSYITALTGDVTATGPGSVPATIANGAVTLAKMANLAANSIIGNNTGVSATPLALTSTQVTAMLDIFSSTLQGLAPASGGGTTNFLRADGTWAAPATGSTNNKELFVLSGTNITNQYVDLAHVALTNSIDFVVQGAGSQIEGASYDYSVNYTGGAGGNTRITFLNGLATGGISALVAGDVVVAQYEY